MQSFLNFIFCKMSMILFLILSEDQRPIRDLYTGTCMENIEDCVYVLLAANESNHRISFFYLQLQINFYKITFFSFCFHFTPQKQNTINK